MRCTTTSAASPASATIRACWTPSLPPCGTWKERRRSRGGSTRQNGSERWQHETPKLDKLLRSTPRRLQRISRSGLAQVDQGYIKVRQMLQQFERVVPGPAANVENVAGLRRGHCRCVGD